MNEMSLKGQRSRCRHSDHTTIEKHKSCILHSMVSGHEVKQ